MLKLRSCLSIFDSLPRFSIIKKCDTFYPQKTRSPYLPNLSTFGRGRQVLRPFYIYSVRWYTLQQGFHDIIHLMEIANHVPKRLGPLFGPMIFEVPKSPHLIKITRLKLNETIFSDVTIVIGHAGWVRNLYRGMIWCFADGTEVLNVIKALETSPDIIIACSGNYFDINLETGESFVSALPPEVTTPDMSNLLPPETSYFHRFSPSVKANAIWDFNENQTELEYMEVIGDSSKLVIGNRLREKLEA